MWGGGEKQGELQYSTNGSRVLIGRGAEPKYVNMPPSKKFRITSLPEIYIMYKITKCPIQGTVCGVRHSAG